MSSAHRRLHSPEFLKLFIQGRSHVEDVSGNGDAGTWGGTETYADGPFGHSMMSFNGSSDVDYAANIGLSGDATFSIAAWVNLSAHGDYDCIASWGDSGVALNAAGLVVMNAGAVGLSFAGARNGHTANGVFSANKWTHLVATKSPGAINTTTAVYVNGERVALSGASSDTPAIVNSPVTVGSFLAGAGTYLWGTAGTIRVYSVPLTGDEAKALYRWDHR